MYKYKEAELLNRNIRTLHKPKEQIRRRDVDVRMPAHGVTDESADWPPYYRKTYHKTFFQSVRESSFSEWADSKTIQS